MRNFKKIALSLTLLVLVLIGVGFGLFTFVLRPTIIVAGDVSNVSVYSAGGAVISQTSGSGTIRLSPGSYSLKVTQSSGAVTEKLFSLQWRQRASFTPATGLAQPKTDRLLGAQTGLEPIVQPTGLSYFDTVGQQFSRIMADGSTQSIYTAAAEDSNDPSVKASQSLTNISPLPAGQELLLASNGTPYFWDGSTVTPLDLTGVNTAELNQYPVLFGSNAHNDDFVLAVGQNVYHYASAAAVPTKVAALKLRFNQLVYGGGKFLAYDTSLPYSNSTDLPAAYAKKYAVYPVLADIQTKQSQQLPQPIVSASISPDGQHLFANYRQAVSASLYAIQGSTVSLSHSLTRSSGLAPVWLSNAAFAYSADDAIWSYDLASNTASALVDAVPSIPSSLTIQPAGSLAYSLLSSSGQGVFYAIASSDKLGDTLTKHLQDLLLVNPPGTTEYSVAYADINQPSFTLSLTYPPGGNNPTIAQVTTSFKQVLQKAGLSPDQFAITVIYNPQR